MGLRLQPTRSIGGKIATLIAVFALVFQPVSGFVASQVANAVSVPKITGMSIVSGVSGVYDANDVQIVKGIISNIKVDVDLVGDLDRNMLVDVFNESSNRITTIGLGKKTDHGYELTKSQNTAPFVDGVYTFEAIALRDGVRDTNIETLSKTVRVDNTTGDHALSNVIPTAGSTHSGSITPQVVVANTETVSGVVMEVFRADNNKRVTSMKLTIRKPGGIWTRTTTTSDRLPNGSYYTKVHVTDIYGTTHSGEAEAPFTISNTEISNVMPVAGSQISGVQQPRTLRATVSHVNSGADIRGYLYDASGTEVMGNAPMRLVAGQQDVYAYHRELDASGLSNGNYQLVIKATNNDSSVQFYNEDRDSHLIVVDNAPVDTVAPTVLSATLNGKDAKIAPRIGNSGETYFNTVGGKFTLGLTTQDATDTTNVRYRVAKVNSNGGTQTNIYRSSWFSMNQTDISPDNEYGWTATSEFDFTKELGKDGKPLADGTYTIQIETRDSLGNTATSQYVDVDIDSTAPKIDAGSVVFNKMTNVNGVDHTGVMLNGGFLDITFTTNEPLKLVGSQVGLNIPGLTGVPSTGWTKVTLIDGADNKYRASISLTNAESRIYEPNFFEGKTFENVKLYFRTVDELNNTDSNYYMPDGSFGKSPSQAYTFTLDNTAPESPEISVRAKANNQPLTNGGFTNRYEIVTSWEKPDGEPVRYLYNYWNDSGDQWSNDNPFSVSTTDLSVGGEFNRGEGTHYLQVFAFDAAGNKSEGSDIFVINYDKTPPGVTILESAEGEVDVTQPFTISGTFSDEFSGVGRLHLYLSANGSTLADPFIVHSSQLNRRDGAFTYTLNQRDLDKLADSPLNLKGGDTFTVKAWAYDRANNWSNVEQEFIVTHTEPVLTADYFMVHADHLGVGFSVERFEDATRVEVEVFGADGSITKNVGTSPAILALINGSGFVTSPFWIPEQPNDAYWTFGVADWANEVPTYVRITIFNGDTLLAEAEVDFESVNRDRPSETYTSLIDSLSSSPDPIIVVPGPGAGGSDGGAIGISGQGQTFGFGAVQNPFTGTFGNTFFPAGDTVIEDDATDEYENGVVAAATTGDAEQGDVLAAEDAKDQWSLVNLLLTIAIAAASLFALIGLAGKREGEKNVAARVLSIVPALGAGAVLYFVEDFGGAMSWVNIWTLLVAGLVVVQMIILASTRSQAE